MESSPLQRAREAYFSVLKYSKDDESVVDCILSAFIANIHPKLTEAVWLHLIGAPGTGKTETISPFYKHPNSVFVSSLSENALMSGYEDEQGSDPSLLCRLNNKNLIIKDMTSPLSDNPLRVAKLLGELRDNYDGYSSKASGAVGLRQYEARFGIIAAVTPIIDIFNRTHQQLGERFLSYRIGRFRTTAAKDIENTLTVMKAGKEKDLWRIKLRGTIHQIIDHIKAYVAKNPLPTISPSNAKILATYAYLLSTLRTASIGGSPTETEKPFRVAQQFQNLGLAHAIADGRQEWNDSDTLLIKRIVIDTFTTPQRRLLFTLYGKNREIPLLEPPQIGVLSRISTPEAKMILEQYTYSGVVNELPRPKTSRYHMYQFSASIRKLLDETGLFLPGPHLPGFSQSPL